MVAMHVNREGVIMKSIVRIVWIATLSAGLTVACAVKPTPAHAPTAADSQPASAEQVRELMRVIGVQRLLEGMAQEMNANLGRTMKRQFPCVSASYWSGFLDASAMKELIERTVPIYQKHFTRGEMNQLLAFYHSPVGQKVVHEMPAIMKEAAEAGRVWGRQRGMQMIDRLRADGRLNEDGSCPAQPPSMDGSH